MQKPNWLHKTRKKRQQSSSPLNFISSLQAFEHNLFKQQAWHKGKYGGSMLLLIFSPPPTSWKWYSVMRNVSAICLGKLKVKVRRRLKTGSFWSQGSILLSKAELSSANNTAYALHMRVIGKKPEIIWSRKWFWMKVTCPLCFICKSMLSMFVRHSQRTLDIWGPSGNQTEFQHLPFTDLKHTKALFSMV